MAENLTDNCLIAEMMTANGWLILILSVKIILDLITLVLLGVYGHCYVTNQGIHSNLRAMVASLVFAQWSRSFLTFVRSSQMVFRAVVFYVSQDNCSLMTAYHFCGIETVINATPVQVIAWSFFVITIERIIATIWYKTFEKIRCVLIPTFVAFAPWGYQLFRSTNLLIDIFKKPNQLVPYCSSMTTIDFVSVLGTLVPVALVTSTIAGIVYYANRKASIFERNITGSDHLTRRYQRIENMEATKAVAILSVTFLICYVTYVFVVHFISIGISSSSSLKPIAKEVASYCLSIHGSFHVLLALYMSEKLRHKFINHRLIRFIAKRICINGLHILRINKRVAPLAEQEDYFNIYKQQWS